MQVKPELLAEIYNSLGHGEIQEIADTLGGDYTRGRVQRELTNLKKNNEGYDDKTIRAAIEKLESRGVVLEHKGILVD